MASGPIDIPVGAVVDISLGRGVVRFFGTTSFSAGKWVGIELSEPAGKNDGSVKGVPYFSCPPNHGVFVKPSQVKIVQDPPSSGTVSTPLYFLVIIDHADLSQAKFATCGSAVSRPLKNAQYWPFARTILSLYPPSFPACNEPLQDWAWSEYTC